MICIPDRVLLYQLLRKLAVNILLASAQAGYGKTKREVKYIVESVAREKVF